MAILQRLNPQNRKGLRKNIFLATSQPLFSAGYHSLSGKYSISAVIFDRTAGFEEHK